MMEQNVTSRWEVVAKKMETIKEVVNIAKPFLELAAPALHQFINNVQSKEVSFVKEQILTLKNKLDVISAQQKEISREMEKSSMDLQYFKIESNIRYQYEKFIDILEAEEKLQEEKKEIFLEQFVHTGDDSNLDSLYDAVMGKGLSEKSILDVVNRHAAGDRGLLVDFCVRLMKLLMKGLTALLGHCGLNQEMSAERVKEKTEEWRSKIKDVELKMKLTIESCMEAFPEHAKADTQRLFVEKGEKDPAGTAKELLEFLKKKYDWVSWSVLLISDSENFFLNWLAGKHFHHVIGQNWFFVPPVNKVNLVVSYSTKPQQVPHDLIQQVMKDQGNKGDAQEVAYMLKDQLRGFVIHAVSQDKNSKAEWSFPDDCYYWGTNKNVAVCVHSE
ncbi:protein rapunzel-like [Myripristis murdjan]|uniref:protein rapunzel-like n=1 Tax=Myripristis murdjan TaxID=586833 RepID=UPI0011760948|nr:protein rapunzel-like [Myripristis murdjan]